MPRMVQLRVRGSNLMLHSFSIEMSPQVMFYNFLILNDSTCQFYYGDNTRIRPYKKSGRGVTCMDISVFSFLSDK